MMATRLKQFGLLLFSMLICGVAFFQMFERTTGGFPQNYLWMLAFVGALFLTSGDCRCVSSRMPTRRSCVV